MSDDALDRVLLQITDGRPVDWATADDDASVSSLARRLRAIEALARTYRTVAGLDDEGLDEADARPVLFEWGKLRIVGSLGDGAQGSVYRAFDPSLRRDVALKLLRPRPATTGEDLLVEARRIAAIRHPHVVTVHGADVHEDQVGIWVDLLDGPTLETSVREDGVLDPAQAALIGNQVCLALDAAHHAGVLHGDVKPANVILEAPHHAVLFDFGSGRRLGSAAGVISGTPRFLPPECFHGRDAGMHGDLYAAGILLFWILTRSYPIEAETWDELVAAHRAGHSRSIHDLRQDIPRDLTEVIERACHVDPSARYESAGEMARALAECGQRLDRVATIVSTGPQEETGPPHNLPEHELEFVGRSSELTRILAGLDEALLTTLAGPGGSGKTRLAIEVARASQSRFPDGVWFCDLTSISEAGRVPQVVADILGIQSGSSDSIASLIRDELETQRLLLVLDNCEQLLPGLTEFVERILPRPGGSTVLCTSRQAIGLEVERVCRVSGLACPDEADLPLPRLLEVESVELLVSRFRTVDPAFRLTHENAAAVTTIARRVEGAPLAIELAAGRLRILGVEQIADRMADQLRLLSGQGQDPRHRSVEASVQWSYDLLTETQRTLFRRLSVFAGGWTVESMEAVCSGGEDGRRLGADELPDLLTELLDRFLVHRAPSRGGAGRRLSLPETVRTYAHSKLEASGERDAVEERFRDHFADLVETVAPKLRTGEQGAALRRLRPEQDNIRRVLDGFVEAGHLRRALRVARFLEILWFIQGHRAEGTARLEELLAASAHLRPFPDRTCVALGVAVRAASDHDLETSKRWLDEGFADAKALNDDDLIAWSERVSGQLAFAAGHFDEADRWLQRSLERGKRIRDTRSTAITLAVLCNVAEIRTDIDQAIAYVQESLRLLRDHDDPQNRGYGLLRLGQLALHKSDYDLAETSAHAALADAEVTDNHWSVAACRHLLGDVAYGRNELEVAAEHFRCAHQGFCQTSSQTSQIRSAGQLITVLVELKRVDEAKELLRRAMDQARRIDSPVDLGVAVAAHARVAAASGDLESAAEIAGALESYCARRGVPLSEGDRREHLKFRESLEQRASSGTSESPSSPDIGEAWKRGASLSDGQVYDLCGRVAWRPSPSA